MTQRQEPAPPGFSILTGNRLERLVAHLAEEMEQRPLPPLEREIVIVQSQGMQRWLTLELARRRGLAASLSTPFPQPFIRHLLRQRDPENRCPASEELPRFDDSLFSRDLLLWRLVEILGGGEGSKSLAAPRAYLADDIDQRKLYQLSSRLGALFAEYQLYRGDLLDGWGSHNHDTDEVGAAAWQRALWRRLLDLEELGIPSGDGPQTPPIGDGPLHVGVRSLIDALTTLEHRPDGLPRRLSMLGVSSLPPLFIDLLVALSRWIPVTVYLVSPTYHYWADLRSEREQARLERRFTTQAKNQASKDLGFENQHFESGHPLLASLGRQGRELFDLLQKADAGGSAWHELAFEEPEGDQALRVLQRDVLHLGFDPSAPTDGEEKWRPRIDAEDRSLTLHICHSPMREMQVLHHEIFRAFDEIEDLRPSDILVLLPNIERYTPYIQAVFGIERDKLNKLPFSVADRGAGREQPPSEAILQILDLASARLTLRQVFDLLETPALLRATGLVEEDIPVLRARLQDAGVRWGLSGEHRAELFDVPADEANTWRLGLDRLLLGYAAGDLGQGEEEVGSDLADVRRLPLIEGISPAAGDTAGDAERLGHFAAFITSLEHWLKDLKRRRPLAEWAATITAMVDDFMVAEAEAEERGLQLVRDSAERLAEAAERIGARSLLSLGVIREHLENQLKQDGFGSGFLNGQITFCALRPMRTIPFRVVAIAGLDAGIFPRRDRRPGFDLMAREPRQGDRSVREDDRYLFLETLLATGDRLILSHIGRSQQDGSPREPSAVLNELMEFVDRHFSAADGGSAKEQITHHHPLQPWSSRYFRVGLKSSFASEEAAVAQALRAERQEEPPLLRVPLPLPIPEAPSPATPEASTPPGKSPRSQRGTKEVTLEELIQFWRSPSQSFLEESLGLSLVRGGSRSLDAEPFILTGLDGWPVRDWLTQTRIKDRAAGRKSDPDAEAIQLRAQGLLPPGALGHAALQRITRDVEAFLDRIPTHRPAPLFSFDIEISGEKGRGDGWRLTGTLDRLTDLGLLHYRCGQVRSQEWLRIWCELLVWTAARGAESTGRAGHPQTPGPAAGFLIGTDASWRLGIPERATALLRSLLEAHDEGSRRPLPFFGEASRAYAEQEWALADPRRRADRPSIEIARAEFEGTNGPPRAERPPALADDPWIRLAFRGRDPLEEADFSQLAQKIWRPILQHRRELEP